MINLTLDIICIHEYCPTLVDGMQNSHSILTRPLAQKSGRTGATESNCSAMERSVCTMSTLPALACAGRSKER